MSKPKWVTGDKLNSADRQDALARFTYRYTRDNVPPWAKGTNYKAQFADDDDWLRNTRFAVTKGGNLDRRFSHCNSNPTFPDGKGVYGMLGVDWFDTLDAVKRAVRDGKSVCWKNTGYRVKQETGGSFIVTFMPNGDVVGLVNSQFRAVDFFVENGEKQ